MEYSKVLLLFTVLFIYESSGNIIVEPTDVVVQRGQQAKFECSIDYDTQADAFRWAKTVTDETPATPKTIYQSYPLDYDYNKVKYTIDNPDKNTFNLIVNNVDKNDAGVYSCSRMVDVSVQGTAKLVMIEEPIVTLPAKILDGHDAQVMCEVNFAGNKDNVDDMKPSLYAKLGHMDITNKGNHEYQEGILGTVTSKLTFTFNETMRRSQHGENLTCTAKTYSPPFQVSAQAKINVLFGVTKESMKIEPLKEMYYIGEIINCSAEGNPEPKVKWSPMESKGAYSPGSVLTVTEQMYGENKWKCIATNTPKDVPVAVEKELSFTVIAATEPPAGKSTGLGSEATIAIGVVVPVVVLAIVIVVVCCICKKRKGAATPKKAPEEDQKRQNQIYRPVNTKDKEQVTFQDKTTAKFSVEEESDKPTAAPRRDGSRPGADA